MKENKLKDLLDKYYEGNTTPSEEQELKQYFAGNDVIPGYETEKEIFRHYHGSEKVALPSAGFENRIIDAVDRYEKMKKKIPFRRRYITIFSAAATILIMAGTLFFLTRESEPDDTFSDPVLAYIETMKILNDVSAKLNRGTEALKPVFSLTGTARNGLRSVDRSLSTITDGLEKAGLAEKLSEQKN